MIKAIKSLLCLNKSIHVREIEDGSFLLCIEAPLFSEPNETLVCEYSKKSPECLPSGYAYQRVWLFFKDREEQQEAENSGLNSLLETYRENIKKSENREIKIDKKIFLDFRNQVVKIENIRRTLQEQYSEWRELEGGDIYIPPKVVSDRIKITTHPNKLVSDYLNNKPHNGFLIYIFGEYGNGKTSFLRNFLNDRARDLDCLPTIPILFNLNDRSAGSIGGFIESELNSKYELKVSLKDFLSLCREGVFTLFFDAFDQMLAVPIKKDIEAGFHEILSFARDRGCVFLACRDYFYLRYLQPLEREGEGPFTDRITLSGFDEDELNQYAEKIPEIRDAGNKDEFIRVAMQNRGKPLLARTIADNMQGFNRLISEREKGNRDISPFDIFDLPYQAWLKTRGQVLGDRQTRSTALRYLIKQITLHGINSSCDFDDWLNAFNRPPNNPIDKSRIPELKDDLASLTLLDRTKIKKRNLLMFASPPYLEFLLAKFVIEELDSSSKDAASLVREICLTPIAREMIVQQIVFEDHGSKLKEFIEDSAYRSFTDVQYQASNGFSIILHAVQVGVDVRWKELLKRIQFRKTVLRDADCEGADLTGLLLTSADLTGCDFSYSTLTNTNMEFSNLKGARFSEYGELLTSSIFYSDREKNHFIVCGTRNGSVVVWSIRDRKIIGRFRPHQCEITALRIGRSNTKIFTGYKDGHISVQNLHDEMDRRIYNPSVRGVCAFVLPSSEAEVLAGGYSGEAIRLSLSPPNRITRYSLGITDDPPWLTALDVTPDEQNIVVGHADGSLRIIRNWAGLDYKVEETSDQVRGVAGICILNDQYALVNDDAAEAYLLSLNDLRLDRLSHTPGIRHISYAVEAKEIFLLSDGSFRYGKLEQITDKSFRLQDYTCLENARTLSVSPDGRFVAVGGSKLQLMDREERFKTKIDVPMHLNCRGMNINFTEGLDTVDLKLLLFRGAQIPSDSLLNKYIDFGEATINRSKRTFKCVKCSEEQSFSEDFEIVGRSLHCKNCK